MNELPAGLLEREGVAALAHMEQALELIDRCDNAADVGGHLDLAICRLRDVMELNGIELTPREPPIL
jgi:hypothetical protein